MIENINLNLVYCKDVQDVLNKIKTNAKEI